MAGLARGSYQRTIRSACKAPACFMAWKIDIISRGVTPSEFNAMATFSTVGISGRAIMEALFSATWVVVCCVTLVSPTLLKGAGWETFCVEAILMVMLPQATAQLEIWM